ncbi:hypothetical protein ACMYYO_03045 [Dermacoccaceae bacterium W4C1]
MKREGVKRMVFGGILFFLVAPAIFVTALVVGIGSSISSFENAAELGPGESTSLTSGDEVSVFVYDGSAPDSSDGVDTGGAALPAADCTVTDPSGGDVALTSSSGDSVTSDGSRWAEAFTFTPERSGNYRFDCGELRALVMPSDIVSTFGQRVGLTLLAAFGLPFLAGVVGLGLFIWGLVRYNKTKPQQYGGGHGGGYQPPQGYGQQGYNQYGQPGNQGYNPYGQQGGQGYDPYGGTSYPDAPQDPRR